MQQAIEIRLERGLAARDGHARYPFALHPVAELFNTHEFNGELRVARPLRIAVRAIQVTARKTDERRELTRVRAFAVDAHEALGYRKGTEYHIYLRFLCLLAAVDRAVVRGLGTRRSVRWASPVRAGDRRSSAQDSRRWCETA